MNKMGIGVIGELANDINILLDKTDSISDLLSIWSEVNSAKKLVNDTVERINIKVKTYLKERQWKRYVDEKTKISVSISSVKKEIIDKQQLSLMLTEAQLAQIIRISSYERMTFITPEMRGRLKNYVKQSKTFSKS